MSPSSPIQLLLLLITLATTASTFYLKGTVGSTEVDLKMGLGDEDVVGGGLEAVGRSLSDLGVVGAAHRRRRSGRRRKKRWATPFQSLAKSIQNR